MIHIVGLGRIGRRLVHICAKNNIEAKIYDKCENINDIYHLLKYDSIYGICNDIKVIDTDIIIHNTKFQYNKNYQSASILVDCTGKEIEGDGKIIRSYPKGDNFYIFGTDKNDISSKIISNASCTTQAIAPVIYMLKHYTSDISFVTVHSYTKDQNLVDSFHKDQYRMRSAALSMIPTSTGASKILSQIFPKININGRAIRVPTANISCIDATFVLNKKISNVNEILSKSEYIQLSKDKLVSIDYIGNDKSAIIDLNHIYINDNLLNMLIWYDNEYGYTCRLFELICLVRNDIQNTSSPQRK